VLGWSRPQNQRRRRPEKQFLSSVGWFSSSFTNFLFFYLLLVIFVKHHVLPFIKSSSWFPSFRSLLLIHFSSTFISRFYTVFSSRLTRIRLLLRQFFIFPTNPFHFGPFFLCSRFVRFLGCVLWIPASSFSFQSFLSIIFKVISSCLDLWTCIFATSTAPWFSDFPFRLDQPFQHFILLCF
jgi:hypothetical protein